MEARVSPNGADSSGSSGVDGPLPNSTRQYEPGAAGIEDHVQFSTSASDTGNSGEKRRSAEEQHRRSFEENAADVQGSIAAAKLQALIFNPRNDVVMRLECMSEKELKNILVIIKLGVFAGIILLCALFVLKFKRNERWFVDHGNIPLLNVVVGAICLATLSGSITHSSWNIRKAIHSDKRWTRRRKYSTVLFFTLPCIQIFSTLAYIVGNSYVLRGNCRWFSGVVIWCGFAQWAIGWGGTFALLAVLGHNSNPAPPLPDGSTIQTEYGLDAMVLDMPVLQYHWPKFAYLAAHITVQLGLCIYLQKNGAGDQAGIFSRHECETGNLNCVMDTVTLTLASVSIVSLVGMLCWWAISIRLAVHNFKRWSYIGHRAGNLNLRFQVRFLSYSVAFFIICCILLWFVKLQSCASFVETWLGFSPLFIVMTVTCVSMAFIYQPKQADPDMALYYVMKQAFSWTEAFKEQKLQLRNAMKPDSEHLQRAPMFCVETAIKLLYFSALCYGYQEEGATSPLNIEVALAMYDLKQHELLREVREDSKVLLAWNHRMMVIAFRGTASIKNVAADLQMWLHVHPREHRKGRRWWRVPMVHAGFHRSWTISGLSEKVLDHVRKCVDSCATPSDKPFQILLTGHSLGGALATMAAVDIAQRVCTAQHPVSISVYTFGAPRTGNHRFAEIYNDLAPDTWSIINDQDLIARGGKFWRIYKRPGQRVLIDKSGTMVVRPMFVESSMRRTGRARARDHHLASYRAAFLAVLAAQFDGRAFHDGMKGVIKLARSLPDVGSVFGSPPHVAKSRNARDRAVSDALGVLESHLTDAVGAVGLAGAALPRGSMASSAGSRGEDAQSRSEDARREEVQQGVGRV